MSRKLIEVLIWSKQISESKPFVQPPVPKNVYIYTHTQSYPIPYQLKCKLIFYEHISKDFGNKMNKIKNIHFF